MKVSKIVLNTGQTILARYVANGCATAVLAVLIGISWNPAIGQAQPSDNDVAGAQVLTRGPVHEAFAGMVTFKKSDALREVARSIPADRILIETDSPYLSPHPLRGKRNEPARLVHTAECLARERSVSLDAFAAQTTANARRLFRL